MTFKKAAPENPKEETVSPEQERLQKIAGLSSPESVRELQKELAKEQPTTIEKSEKETDEKQKEKNLAAKKSVDQRFELIQSIAA